MTLVGVDGGANQDDGRLRRLWRRSGGRLTGWIKTCLGAEQDRWRLWGAVLFATGCGIHVDLVGDPPLWLLVAATAAIWSLSAMARARRPWLALTCLGFAWMAGGMAVSGLGTTLVMAPVLEQPYRGPLAGRVLAVEPDGAGGGRLLIVPAWIDGLTRDTLPARVRVTVRPQAGGLPAPGDGVRMRVNLSSPSAPVVPGGYDFARAAYFQQLGAIGYAYGSAMVTRPPAPRLTLQTTREAVERGRLALDRRIRQAAPGAGGAVLSAMVTGLRGAIPDAVDQGMRDSGLAHLISISGLHMTMVAGLIFGVVRLAMALLPAVADRISGRKVASLAALAGAAGYLALGGFAVPTQRAFIMTGLGLLAILANRPVLSMSLIASSAIVVLAVQPAAIIGPSFQMSFAAVVALIALYESPAVRRLAGMEAGDGRAAMSRAGAWFFGMLATSSIAGLATAPYAAYAFGRATGYGLVSNLIAVPLTGFWIMPTALAGSLATLLPLPDGFNADLLFTLSARGMDLVIATATMVASWSGAVVLVPAFGAGALLLMTFGGLWLAIWRRPWRWAGLVPVLAGVIMAAHPALPDILVSDDGRSLAIRGHDGALLATDYRRNRFVLNQWAEALGTDVIRPLAADTTEPGLACHAGLCRMTRQNLTAALVLDGGRLAEACGTAQLVVIAASAAGPGDTGTPPCAARLIDRRRPGQTAGSLAIRLGPDGVTVDAAGSARGQRPWVRAAVTPVDDVGR